MNSLMYITRRRYYIMIIYIILITLLYVASQNNIKICEEKINKQNILHQEEKQITKVINGNFTIIDEKGIKNIKVNQNE